MNILIQFEDSYGCRTLFEHSNSILNNHADVKINGGLSNSGVFIVTKRMVQNYDYVIVVFDMDSPTNFSLVSKELKVQLSKSILDKDGNIKATHANKIILIPIYFCFETLMLYSKQLQTIIKNADSCDDCEMIKLIKMYKSYYDYSKINPENMKNIKNNIIDIQKSANKITGNTNYSNTWLPQQFHTSYMKQLFKYTYREKRLSDEIFKKKEKELFHIINNSNELSVSNILNDLYMGADKNKYIVRLLTLNDMSELSKMTIENNLEYIYNELDNYNFELKYGKISM